MESDAKARVAVSAALHTLLGGGGDGGGGDGGDGDGSGGGDGSEESWY